jgi:hypothetical protein
MTPGPPATEDVFGQLAAMRVIPVVVLDDSVAAVPLAGALADAGLPCAEITRTAAGDWPPTPWTGTTYSAPSARAGSTPGESTPGRPRPPPT